MQPSPDLQPFGIVTVLIFKRRGRQLTPNRCSLGGGRVDLGRCRPTQRHNLQNDEVGTQPRSPAVVQAAVEAGASYAAKHEVILFCFFCEYTCVSVGFSSMLELTCIIINIE